MHKNNVAKKRVFCQIIGVGKNQDTGQFWIFRTPDVGVISVICFENFLVMTFLSWPPLNLPYFNLYPKKFLYLGDHSLATTDSDT